MTAETLQRIQETIRLLNYHPSSVARSLVTSSTATIGVIIAEIDTPLFLQCLNNIELTARSAGYNILLCTARNFADENEAVRHLLNQQVEGIIFLLTSVYPQEDYFTRLSGSAPPLVLINRVIESDRFDQVNWDNAGGMVIAVEYLARLGHHHIAHLYGPANRRSSAERLQGYRLGLARAGLAYRPDYIQPGDYTVSPETWRQSTLDLLTLSPRPTAISAANDIVAATVMRTLSCTGLHVPADVAVVGIDDQPFCTYLTPALTTIQLPVIEAGQRAIDTLLLRLAGQDSPREKVLLPCPLIVRESS